MSAIGLAVSCLLLLICIVPTIYVWKRVRGGPPIAKIDLKPGVFQRMAEEALPVPEPMSGWAEDWERSVDTPEKRSERRSRGNVSRGEASGYGAAFVDGMVPALDMWSRWESVDATVLQAISHMTHKAIGDFGDLMQTVDAKGYAVESVGFLNKLSGHIAEWKVQEHFMSAGTAVSMPFATNEPGLDMWLDGHAVNVKNVSDVAAAAREHFRAHADIPIVVPADASGIPDDAVHFDPAEGLDFNTLDHTDHLVIVDHALSHADTIGEAHNAVDTLMDAGPHAHIPWVTLAVSAFREGNLLLEGSTDVSRAAKNVAVDTAAVGGAGFIGAKAGAAIGSVIAPGIGTAIGALIGGIGGAFAGRTAANAIKKAPLERAKENLQRAQDDYRTAERHAMAFAEGAWLEARGNEQSHLSDALEELRKQQEATLATLQAISDAAALVNFDQATVYLATARKVVDLAEEVAYRRAPDSFPWPLCHLARWLAPNADEEARILKTQASAWRRDAAKLLANWQDDHRHTCDLFDLVIAAPNGHGVAAAFLRQAAQTRRAAFSEVASVVKNTLGAVLGLRKAAVERLRARWQRIEEEVAAMLAAPRAHLAQAVETMRWELGAAGKS